MIKRLTIMFVCCIVVSCQDNKNNWLQSYQESKCLWHQTEIKFSKDTIEGTEKLHSQIIQVGTKIKEVERPYKERIVLIKKNIQTIKQKYHSEYRRISDAHSFIYGHISTPEYEKKVAQVTLKSENEVVSLQKEISTVNIELERNKNYRDLNRQSDQLKKEISERKSSVKKEKYQLIFDSLQRVIDNQNLQFKSILLELKESEKQDFINQRENVRTNPCKNIN
ncbi:MAG: hypothetical protein HYZ54_03325 [Ignavibacteriae bacterium]|nr:hypothetical protein [Ignavibacteriota bacterium]